MTRHTRFLPVLAALSLAAACGPDEGGTPDPRKPYGPLNETTVAQVTGTMPLMDPATKYDFGVVGHQQVAGRDYAVWKFGHDVPQGAKLDASTPGTVVYVDGIGTDRLSLGGFLGEFGLSATLQTPVVLEVHPPVGKQLTATATALVTSPGDPTGKTATLSVTYSLVEDDVTVTTRNLGDVSGCRHFQGTFTVDGAALPAFLQGKTGSGDIWYHPGFGVVDARSPDLGFDLGMEGENDWSEPVDGAAVGRLMTVLDGQRTEVAMSTYDRAGAYDADMCVHCKMLVEVRWADETDAKTRDQPDPTLFRAQFDGGMGTFCWGGCPLVESPVSIFHPEDNGKGYRFWYAYVSEALKNEVRPGGSTGSAYSIRVSKDGSLPPIRVTARIAYSLVSPSSDCSM